MLLKSGALIAPVQIVEERTIGPSLGAQNVEQGINASFWGLIVVILFMLIYYKIFGVIASFALVITIVLLVGLMSILPGATLSMPGIAGIVLTLGMSVDANVLIFERIKEEIRNGRPIQQAINEGYNGAFTSIFDANLCSWYRPNSRLCGNSCIRCGNFNVYSDYRNTCYRELHIRR